MITTEDHCSSQDCLQRRVRCIVGKERWTTRKRNCIVQHYCYLYTQGAVKELPGTKCEEARERNLSTGSFEEREKLLSIYLRGPCSSRNLFSKMDALHDACTIFLIFCLYCDRNF